MVATRLGKNSVPGAIIKALAAAFAVGIGWALLETVLLVWLVPRGFFLSAGFFEGFRGRAIFYGSSALVLWAALGAARFVWARIRRRPALFPEVAAAALKFLALLAASATASFYIGYAVYKAVEATFLQRVLLFAGALLVTGGLFLLVGKGWAAAARRWRVFKTCAAVTGRVILIAACILGVGSIVWGWVADGVRPTPRGRPDVVFITLDAWRADVLRPEIAPNLTTFARDHGFVYTNARSAATWTLPSFAATFTGAYNVTDSWGLERGREKNVTWAQAMRAAGYDTYAVVKNPYFENNRYVTRGFKYYRYIDHQPLLTFFHFYDTAWRVAFGSTGFQRPVPAEDSRVLTARSLDVLAPSSRRPRFLWVHYLDPHYPYDPPPEVLARVAPRITAARAKAIRDGGLEVNNAAGLHILYEAEAAATDRELKPLLDTLARRPNTVVIISADHGECFAEHGAVAHGRDVYEEDCRVPLIVASTAPGAFPPRGGSSTTAVSLTDLAPSVLSYLGIPLPANMAKGRRDLLAAGAAQGDRPVFVVRRVEDSFSAAAVLGDKKLIITARGGPLAYEYYDLAADPGEKKPLPLDETGRYLDGLLRRDFGPAFRLRLERGGKWPLGKTKELRDLGYVH